MFFSLLVKYGFKLKHAFYSMGFGLGFKGRGLEIDSTDARSVDTSILLVINYGFRVQAKEEGKQQSIVNTFT